MEDISLEVQDGEYFVVLGPTGSGKTLLLEILAGFHRVDGGRVLLDDEEITHLIPRDRGMGFVYQDYMLFPNMDVGDNIAYGMRVRGMKGEAVDEKVKELAELFNIVHILDRSPRNLSGGEAQRTALARALAVEPRILLLDEPLSSLDPNLQGVIRKELKRIHREMGTTTIHVTHSREEAMILGDKIAVMNQGRIIQAGPPDEVFRKPQSRFVAEFVGVENIFKGTVRKHDGVAFFTCDGVSIQSSSALEGEVQASIRPEDIIISLEEMKSSARNCLSGRVREIIDTGALMRVSVDCGIPFTVSITRESCVDMGLSIDKEVFLVFKAQNVNLFE